MVLLFCYTKILVTQTFSIMFRDFSCIFAESYDKLTMVRKT